MLKLDSLIQGEGIHFLSLTGTFQDHSSTPDLTGPLQDHSSIPLQTLFRTTHTLELTDPSQDHLSTPDLTGPLQDHSSIPYRPFSGPLICILRNPQALYKTTCVLKISPTLFKTTQGFLYRPFSGRPKYSRTHKPFSGPLNYSKTHSTFSGPHKYSLTGPFQNHSNTPETPNFSNLRTSKYTERHTQGAHSITTHECYLCLRPPKYSPYTEGLLRYSLVVFWTTHVLQNELINDLNLTY